MVSQSTHLHLHIKKCQFEVEEVFKGGKYRNKKTVFEHLNSIGIYVPEDDRYDPYFAVYDFEALQVPINEELRGRRLKYEHFPATLSICSNIPGYTEPIHIRSYGDPHHSSIGLLKNC